MAPAGQRLFSDEFPIHAPPVRTTPYDMQRARRSLVRAITDAEDITHPRLRRAILRSLYTVAAELGCAVCGSPIKLRELEDCETGISLVHLWGSCSDKLASMLGSTPDEVLAGECWK